MDHPAKKAKLSHQKDKFAVFSGILLGFPSIPPHASDIHKFSLHNVARVAFVHHNTARNPLEIIFTYTQNEGYPRYNIGANTSAYDKNDIGYKSDNNNDNYDIPGVSYGLSRFIASNFACKFIRLYIFYFFETMYRKKRRDLRIKTKSVCKIISCAFIMRR